jgi:cysteinyl-tRNA synthetase
MSSEEAKRIEFFRVNYLRHEIKYNESLIRDAPMYIARMQAEVKVLTETAEENERMGRGRDWEVLYDLEDFKEKLRAALASPSKFALNVEQCKAELASIEKVKEEQRLAEPTAAERMRRSEAIFADHEREHRKARETCLARGVLGKMRYVDPETIKRMRKPE